MPPEARPLDGWQEIAAYLGITVRTAQRWERDRGLPVRRESASPRARVWSDPAEIEL